MSNPRFFEEIPDLITDDTEYLSLKYGETQVILRSKLGNCAERLNRRST